MRKTPRRRSRFFVVMAVVLLVIGFAGFGRTFFLKSFFEAPELPWYLLLHGAVLTVWFGLLLVQSLLISGGRIATHRRLGRVVVATGVFAIVMTFFLILGADASREARGVTGGVPIAMLVLGDFSQLAAFSILMTFGIVCRHRPALHKRAMLFASIALMTPGVARLPRIPALTAAGPVLVPAVIISLLLANWVHDLFNDRRIHAVTVCGTALILGGFLAASAFANTESGKAFVAAISFASR